MGLQRLRMNKLVALSQGDVWLNDGRLLILYSHQTILEVLTPHSLYLDYERILQES